MLTAVYLSFDRTYSESRLASVRLRRTATTCLQSQEKERVETVWYQRDVSAYRSARDIAPGAAEAMVVVVSTEHCRTDNATRAM